MNVANEQLPAFLRRRNGRLEMVLHATWLQDWSRCQTRFAYSYDVGIEPTTPKVELNFGKAVHAAMAMRFRSELAVSAVHPGMDQLEMAQRTMLTAHFDSQPQPADEYRNAGRAMELIAAFNAAHPAFDWQVLGVEEKFEVEVGAIITDCRIDGAEEAYSSEDDSNPTSRIPVYFAGTKDLIAAWHNGLWVVDWKTTKDWNDDLSKNRNLLEGRRSFQFRGYAWAERATRRELEKNPLDATLARPAWNLPVLGTCGFWLVCRPPYSRPPSKPTPREHFHCEPFAFDAGALEEWRTSFLDKASSILRAWSTRNYDMAWGLACGGIGRCPFYDVCETKPTDRNALIAAGNDYQPRTRVEDAVAESAD